MEIDPVCGMEVEEKTAKWISDYKGKKYYYCNLHDKREFEKNPEKYTSRAENK